MFQHDVISHYILLFYFCIILSGEVLYHLVQEDFNDGLFSIGNNGSITLLKSLSDFGEGSVVNLTVYAVDVGGLQDSTLVYFVILAKTVPKMEPDNIQYFTFFSYARNMAWFVPLMFVIVGTFGVLIHTIYKGYCKCNTKRYFIKIYNSILIDFNIFVCRIGTVIYVHIGLNKSKCSCWLNVKLQYMHHCWMGYFKQNQGKSTEPRFKGWPKTIK